LSYSAITLEYRQHPQPNSKAGVKLKSSYRHD
jgi:hypothetical protein